MRFDRTRVLVLIFMWRALLEPFTRTTWAEPLHRCYLGLDVRGASRAELYLVRGLAD